MPAIPTRAAPGSSEPEVQASHPRRLLCDLGLSEPVSQRALLPALQPLVAPWLLDFALACHTQGVVRCDSFVEVTADAYRATVSGSMPLFSWWSQSLPPLTTLTWRNNMEHCSRSDSLGLEHPREVPISARALRLLTRHSTTWSSNAGAETEPSRLCTTPRCEIPTAQSDAHDSGTPDSDLQANALVQEPDISRRY